MLAAVANILEEGGTRSVVLRGGVYLLGPFSFSAVSVWLGRGLLAPKRQQGRLIGSPSRCLGIPAFNWHDTC